MATGSQLQQVETALLSAFSRDDLARMTRLHLEVTLEHVAGGDTLTAVVHRLTTWAEAQGRLADLIAGAAATAPHNPALKQLVQDAAAWTQDAAPQPAPPAAPPAVSGAVSVSGAGAGSAADAAGDFAYDVFISYSAQDKAWVRGELLPRLEQAGLRVCIDFRDFRPGAPSVTEMERGVLTARRTLLVLTPAYLASAWTEFETLLLQTLDPANRTRRLIPLRKELCDLPLRIRYLTYVDFADPDDLASAWRQLLTGLGAAPEQLTPAPATPATWLLAHPYAMPPNFTGRTAERSLLNAWLAGDGGHGDHAGHPLLVLRALGGFGKSALTWHWLTHDVDARRWPRVVWWSFYESDASFEAFLARTLEYLNLDPRRYGPRQQAEVLLQALAQPGTLLILDGFERQLRAFSGLAAAYQGDEIGRLGDWAIEERTPTQSPNLLIS